MPLCPACELDAALSRGTPARQVLARLQRAIGELHSARQLLEADGNRVAAEALSEVIRAVEAVGPGG